MSLFSSFNLCVQKLLYSGRFVSWLSLTLTLKGLLLDDQEVLNDQFLSITALGHLIWLWKELKKLPCRKGRCGHLNKQTFEKIWAIHQKKNCGKTSLRTWGQESTMKGLESLGLVKGALSVIPTNTWLSGVQNFVQITANNYTAKCRSGVRVSG